MELEDNYYVLNHLICELVKPVNISGADMAIMPDSYFEDANNDPEKIMNIELEFRRLSLILEDLGLVERVYFKIDTGRHTIKPTNKIYGIDLRKELEKKIKNEKKENIEYDKLIYDAEISKNNVRNYNM